MIGKLVNGVLITPSKNELKKIIITNPSIESLKFNMGFKDLVVDEEPNYDFETQYLESIFEETDTTIINHWEVKEIAELEEIIEGE